MKQVVVGLGIVCALASGIALGQDEEGWIELFNGNDLEGWERKGGEATYKVEDGAIVGTSVPNTDNSFLCTKKHFSDFVLEFEFQAHPALNSGVQVRSNSREAYKKGRVHGYQCELEQEARDRDWFGGIYDEGRRGWLYPHEDQEELKTKFSEQGKRVWKNGAWNKVRIEAKGDRIRTWVNGEARADLTDGMTDSGFVGLQVHGVGKSTAPWSVRWRNLRLKEIKEQE